MLFQDVPGLGLWQTDFETGQTFWSKEMFMIYGLQPNIHSPSVDVLMKYLHRDDRDFVTESIHQATKSLTPFSFFLRIVCKSRVVRSLYSMGGFEIEENGKVNCRYGCCLDITGLSEEESNEVKKYINIITLPRLEALLKLDTSNKDITALLELAAAVSCMRQSRVARNNVGRATT